MSELEELKRKLEIANKKIAILEETISTLKKMQLSQEMQEYINNSQQVLSVVSLINRLSDKAKIDIKVPRDKFNKMISDKEEIDKQIETAVFKRRQETIFKSDDIDDTKDYTQYLEYDKINYKIKPPRNRKSYKYNYDYIQNIKKLLAVLESIIFSKNDDGTFSLSFIEIRRYIGFDNKEIVIPDKIDGLPVIIIGRDAFKNSPLEKIILPDSIEEIKRNAFSGCTNLKTIELPDSLVKIGQEAFNLSGLNYIKINVEKIPQCCFNYCNHLKQVDIGEKVKTICFDSFNNTAIEKITIPETVVEIKRGGYIIENNIKDIAFLGKNTEIYNENMFDDDVVIYCLPGSKAQEYARNNGYTVKELNEFPKN